MLSLKKEVSNTALYQKYFEKHTQQNNFESFTEILPQRIRLSELCQILGITREQVKKFIDADPSFPKPIKNFKTRRSGVYFDISQVDLWMKKNSRNYFFDFLNTIQ